MSKELEVLRVIEESYLHGTAGEYREKLRKDILVLEKALTPPTADEVCGAIGSEVGDGVIFNEKTKEFTGESDIMFLTETYGDGKWTINFYVSAKTLILIGRFYEGLEE